MVFSQHITNHCEQIGLRLRSHHHDPEGYDHAFRKSSSVLVEKSNNFEAFLAKTLLEQGVRAKVGAVYIWICALLEQIANR